MNVSPVLSHLISSVSLSGLYLNLCRGVCSVLSAPVSIFQDSYHCNQFSCTINLGVMTVDMITLFNLYCRKLKRKLESDCKNCHFNRSLKFTPEYAAEYQ